MSKLVGYVTEMNAELGDAIGRLDQHKFDSFLEAVVKAGKIARHDVGREGLTIRALAIAKRQKLARPNEADDQGGKTDPVLPMEACTN
jgi:hypothetical protein